MPCLSVIKPGRHPKSSACEAKSKSEGKTMKKTTFHMITGLLAMGLVFGVNFAQAQAGTLDPTFGNGGTVTANLGVTATTLTAFEQSNGNIAVVTGFNKTSFPGVEGFAL